ncbi:MAG: hypothetical protein EA352_00995 [Gemmatimonadales bacterium]|nr:MAG: hypothetical protein EA352_00995 [Gemmatimonadales bacterium]
MRPALLPVRRRAPGPSLLRTAAALGTMTALVACGGDTAEDAGGGGETEHVLEASATQVLGTTEALSVVRDLTVDASGTVWVLNETAPFFTAFGPEGEVVVEMGSQGEGPGEFAMPSALASTTGGEGAGVWTYDRMRHAMVRVSGPDAALAGETGEAGDTPVPLPRDDIRPGGFLPGTGGIPGMYPWMESAGGSVFAAHPGEGMPRGTGFWEARIVEISPATGEATERWAMEAFLPDPEEHHPGATEFLPIPLWAICDDGSGWMYDPALHRVRPLDDADAEGRSLLPRRQVAFTPDRLFDLLLETIRAEVPSSERPADDELRTILAAEIEEIIDDFAQVFPEYYQLQCAPDGGLWLQRFDWSEGYGGASPTWERLPADGGESELIRFPAGFQVFRIDAGRAWGIVRDEMDIPAVASIELP